MELFTRRVAGALFAEFWGSVIFILFGCLGCVHGEKFPNTQFQMGINFGLLVMVCIQLFHAISGAHINPCITVAAMIMQEVKWYIGLSYILVQFIGYWFGYFLTMMLGPKTIVRNTNFCTTVPAHGFTTVQAILIEMGLTMGWVFAMCASWDKRNRHFRDSLGMRVGFVVGALIVTGGNFTGGSMNPFRSLIPGIYSGMYKKLYVYVDGPLVGTVLAAIFWRFGFGFNTDGGDEGTTDAA